MPPSGNKITLQCKYQMAASGAATKPSNFMVEITDCIKETDVTSVTSPIGLWTAARKPIVYILGRAILKISGACGEK